MIRNGLCKRDRDIANASQPALERDRAAHAVAVPAQHRDFG
jgi:hypothetical protein